MRFGLGVGLRKLGLMFIRAFGLGVLCLWYKSLGFWFGVLG